MGTGFSGGFKFGVNKKPWTDEGGNTWRKMDNGTTLWWNGTDWQQS